MGCLSLFLDCLNQIASWYTSFSLSSSRWLWNRALSAWWDLYWFALGCLLQLYWDWIHREPLSRGKYVCQWQIFCQALISNISLCTVDIKRTETRPVILHSPANTTKPLFASVNLTCVADGYPLPMFQWYRDGLLIPNAVQAFYYIDQVTPDLRGYYTCEAMNSQGAVTSNPGLVAISSEFSTIGFILHEYRYTWTQSVLDCYGHVPWMRLYGIGSLGPRPPPFWCPICIHNNTKNWKIAGLPLPCIIVNANGR